MKKIERIQGTGIPLLLDDIDTDRIIPARYLRCVTFEGLGEHAFEDDRKQDPNHPFNLPKYQGSKILVVGRNFGCGSSREHAPQALIRWGIQAIVGVSYAEIFFGNCTSNGVPCLTASVPEIAQLVAEIEANPKGAVSVDLIGKKVKAGVTTINCTIPDSAWTSLTSGQWDFLAQLVEAAPEIRETARKIPYLSGF